MSDAYTRAPILESLDRQPAADGSGSGGGVNFRWTQM
jgi:hypothetical protein